MAKTIVLWARMTGFPYWPARPCTPLEEANLKNKAGKSKQVAVVFLGLKRDSGWVPDNGVAPFTVESMVDKFSMKKLKGDKDYRAAVIESVRILIANGEVFPEPIMEGILQYEKNFPANPPSYCLLCSGTEISGPLMQCAHCYVAELHWHCHRVDDIEPLTGSWICDKCCLTNGLPLGSLLPFEDADEDSGTGTETATNASVPLHKKQKGAAAGGGGNSSGADNSAGYADHILVKTKTQKGLLSDITSAVAASSAAVRETPPVDHSVEDFCFVCGQDGKLLVCDFPGCTKVYHKVCILGSYSSLSGPDAEENNGEGPLVSSSGSSSALDEETFFCPRHTCLLCQSLDTTPCSLSSIDLPLSYYTLTPEGVQAPNGRLTQKPLKSCTKCPFSICRDCERDCCNTAISHKLSASGSAATTTTAATSSDDDGNAHRSSGGCRSVFHSRRFDRGVSEDLVCLNCCSPNPTLKLARTLEVAWMRMCSSRLALPFLSPLLPISSTTDPTGNGHQPDSSVTASQEMDLLTIIRKIRLLKYDSLKSFHRDLNIIRNTLINKVRDAVISAPRENELFMESDANYKAIIGAFDSLMDGCSHYLRSRELLLTDYTQRPLLVNSINNNNNSYEVTAVTDCDGDAYWTSGDDVNTPDNGATTSQGPLSGGSKSCDRKRARDEVADLESDYCESGSSAHASGGTALAAVKELMLKLWRIECGGGHYNDVTSNSSKDQSDPTVASAYHVRVTPRSLLAWSEYLNAGEVSCQYRGQRDGWSVVPMLQQASSKQHAADQQARKRVRQMLEEAHDYTEEMNNDLLAAHFMVDMRNSHARDGVSLLEEYRIEKNGGSNGARVDRHSNGSSRGGGRDDTLLILDRLREVTQKATQLETRLREDYLLQQRSLVVNSSEGLTIGEVGVLKELKLANDNLRWKLNYKAQVIAASQTIIGELRQSLKERDATIEQLKLELQYSLRTSSQEARETLRPLNMVIKRSLRKKKPVDTDNDSNDSDGVATTEADDDEEEEELELEEGQLPSIAVIGRPNTGKSTIVNKLTDTYQDGSIVHDEPGITRDRSYKLGFWRGYNFQVIDTGGILFDDKKDIFTKHITHQAAIALKEATCAIMVVDGQEGLQPQDVEIAEWLKKNNKKVPVYVAVNKCESIKLAAAQAEKFKVLGLGEPYPVSGIHGRGLAELLDILTEEHMVQVRKVVPQNYTNVAIVGRPNVGKSSLFNRLYGGNRTIVSDVAGTTRDAIDEIIHRKNMTYKIIDTAGIRRKGKITFGPEFFMINRAFKAIRRAEVVILMLDAVTGIVEQDRILAEQISAEGRACVIVLNKWDAVKDKDEKTYLRAVENVRANLPALRWAEIVLISATMGQRTEKLFDCIDRAAVQFKRRVPTAVLNEVVNDATLWLAPPTIGSRNGRIYYCSQSSTQPPTMVFFVNDVKLFTDNYKRYLERKIRESLNFEGSPIQMVWRGKTLRRMDQKIRKGEAKLVGVPGHK